MTSQAVAIAAPITDSVSFTEFVATQSGKLIGFAYLLTGEREDARDIVQDVLIRLYPRWPRIAATGDPGAYVRRCIANANVSAARRRRRRMPPTTEVSVPDSAEATAARDWAVRLCAELPKRQRIAVVLRVLEDREFAEIAEICNCSQATARSLVSRGLARLRDRLAQRKEIR
ncbi:MAG: SigE family RNA polymerase sigma factor [Propionibacteriaceae bacterium]|jgi:RNA polymerase sigma-70 factor (sigma-E family)|nr:SigE family RNA polymerase sigma factor [Propionibacteriaceae bacterium]